MRVLQIIPRISLERIQIAEKDEANYKRLKIS